MVRDCAVMGRRRAERHERPICVLELALQQNYELTSQPVLATTVLKVLVMASVTMCGPLIAMRVNWWLGFASVSVA